ncbi:MAG TPA: hypothetical protein VK942_08320 [Actinomycetes bacterium]|nr:hypothetical protein [Actinomycetes bacterium]
MATSSGRRLLRYLYSNKNLVGSAAGLAGLGLFFTGVVGELWPVVVAGMYGIGALATPPTRSIDLRSGLDPSNLNRAMGEQERRLRGRVPDEVLAAVGRIHGQIREVLDRRHALPPGSPDAYVVERTTLDYLPTALESYLSLPRGYANRVAVSRGRTARQVLLDQLALLEAKLGEVLEAVAKGDTDRLLAHGRFLEDRFAASELDIGRRGA